MNFTTVEIEEVLSIFQDESQDPEYISESTGMEIEKVLSILNHLQSQGDIQGFNKIERKMNISEDKVILFSESIISPDLRKELKIDQLVKGSKDKNYFFDEKDINEVYNAHIFEIKVTKVIYQNAVVIFPLVVTIKNHDFEMFMVYHPDENVYYASEKGESLIKLKSLLGNNSELFDEVTERILNDHIPQDFWEVKNIQN